MELADACQQRWQMVCQRLREILVAGGRFEEKFYHPACICSASKLTSQINSTCIGRGIVREALRRAGLADAAERILPRRAPPQIASVRRQTDQAPQIPGLFDAWRGSSPVRAPPPPPLDPRPLTGRERRDLATGLHGGAMWAAVAERLNMHRTVHGCDEFVDRITAEGTDRNVVCNAMRDSGLGGIANAVFRDRRPAAPSQPPRVAAPHRRLTDAEWRSLADALAGGHAWDAVADYLGLVDVLTVSAFRERIRELDRDDVARAVTDAGFGAVARAVIATVRPADVAPPAAAAVADAGTCVICTERAASVAFNPCGHQCCCAECAAAVPGRVCPICRARIVSTLKIYPC